MTKLKQMKNRFQFLYLISCAILLSCVNQHQGNISSPHQRINVNINADNGIHYAVHYNQNPVINRSKMALALKGDTVLESFKILKSEEVSVDTSWKTVKWIGKQNFR